MYQIFKQIINFIGLIPFMRYFLKVFYLWALKKVERLALEIEEIEDVLLISKLDHKNFIYGQSDLNLVFVIKDDSHPRKALSIIRENLKTLWPANILVNTSELSVLKNAELNTPLIRSFLVKQFFSDEVRWQSIYDKKIYKFNLKTQDHYSIQYQYIRNIENNIFSLDNLFLSTNHELRSRAKKVFNSITGLSKYNLIKGSVNKKWEKLSQTIMSFSFFKKKKFEKLKFLSFEILDGIQKQKDLKTEVPSIYHEELVLFCEKLLKKDYVYDTFLAPALIQLDHDSIKGRIYIDVLIDTKMISPSSYNDLVSKVKAFERKETKLKYIFSISTFEINQLKDSHCLGDYPLRGFYRAQQGYSFNNYKYEFSKDKKQIEKAAIHYLLNQFLFFRSKEHKEQLIGSKFIKSLNIIYQYKLLLENLQGKEFAVSHNYRSIIEQLGVQLSTMDISEVVDDESWALIRSQMLYILKQIRDELSKKYPSLKNIQF